MSALFNTDWINTGLLKLEKAMDEIRYQINMTYSLPVLKKSVFRYWKRALGWRYFIAMLFVSFCFISALIKGDTSWMMGAFAVIFTLGLLFGASVYLNNRYHVLGTFNALQDPTVTFKVYDEKFGLSSELGEGEWPWSAIKEIWQYPDTWLVFLARASYATFPLNTIPTEAQRFVLEKVEEAGGLIK